MAAAAAAAKARELRLPGMTVAAWVVELPRAPYK